MVKIGLIANLLAGLTALQLLAGCGSVNTVQYHEPSVRDTSMPSQLAGDGLAFVSENMCFHVREVGNKQVQPRAFTLLGLPVLPVDLSADKPPEKFFSWSCG